VEWEAKNQSNPMVPIYAYEREETEELVATAESRRSHLEAAIAAARQREAAALAAIDTMVDVERQLGTMLIAAQAELDARRRVVEAGAVEIVAEGRRHADEIVAHALATASLLREAAAEVSAGHPTLVAPAPAQSPAPMIDLSSPPRDDELAVRGGSAAEATTDAFIRALHDRPIHDAAEDPEGHKDAFVDAATDAFIKSLTEALADTRPLGSLAPAG
jgi:hypothetical protein